MIHVLPQEYVVDDQDGVKEPVGMSGVRLEAKALIVTGAVSSAQNIVKCAQRTGLNVADIVLQPLASSLATLSDDEKELGVCLVDIGGGTTDIAVFHNGSIQHTAVISLGGNHLTNDVAVGLRTPTHEAERIKKQYGCAMALDGRQGRDDRGPERRRRPAARPLAPHPRRDRRAARRGDLHARPARAAEVRDGGDPRLGRRHHRRLDAPRRMPEMAEEVLGLPVRRGMPRGIGGLVDVVKSPMYATAVGLVHLRRPAAGRRARTSRSARRTSTGR